MQSAEQGVGIAPCTPGSPLLQVVQVFFRVQCRHAARAGAGHGLAINVVLHVARREYAGYAGGGRIALVTAAGEDVAVLHFELPLEDLRIGCVADGDEQSMHFKFAGSATLYVPDADSGDARLVPKHLIERAVPLDADIAALGLRLELVDQDLLGAELFAAVDHGDMARDV